MRVAIGGFIHEGNSFSVEKIGLEKFREMIYTESENLVDAHRGDRRILGGFIDYAEEKNWEVVPLVTAYAMPAGPIKAGTYELIRKSLCDPLKGEKIDGILLHLHGAIVSEKVDDCEGDILTEVRRIVGKDVPVIIVSDLHANVSPAMVNNVNGMFGYNTQPHADMYEREEEAAALLERIVVEGIKTCTVMAQPPVLLPAVSTDTAMGAMKPVIDFIFDLEKDRELINVSAFAGFYGSDTYNIGASGVVTVEEKNREKGLNAAKKVADYFWEKKDTFFVKTVSVEDAVKKAQTEGGFYGFCDEADDPMGGGPGDGTYILKKLMDLRADNVGIVTIHDPEIAVKAYKIGIGGIISGKLGAKKDHLHGEPVEIKAEVVALNEGRIPFTSWNEEDTQNPGKIAVLRQDGITIVVTEYKTCTEMIDIFKYLDMDSSKFNILVMKGLGESYQLVYKDIAAGFMTIDSIGITNPDVTKLGNFKNVRHPIYPIDKNTELRYE